MGEDQITHPGRDYHQDARAAPRARGDVGLVDSAPWPDPQHPDAAPDDLPGVDRAIQKERSRRKRSSYWTES